MFSKSIVKYIQSLQHKKFRDAHNAFIAEGNKVVSELIGGNNFVCNNIYATNEWINDNEKLLLGINKEKIREVKDFELEKIAAFSTPNFVVAEFQKNTRLIDLNLKNKITVLLDDIRDPGNFGTIIRTADWFGIETIICSEQTVDMYNPKVIQSTMASFGRVNIVYTNLEEIIKKHHHIKSYAASLDGKDLQDCGKLKEGFIIIGNESKGISGLLLHLATERITIPRSGSAESLNAAVAAGIIFYTVIQHTKSNI